MAATGRDARPEIVLETARAQTVVKDDETLVLAPAGSYSSLRFEDGFQLVVVEDGLDVILPTDGPPDPCNRGWTVYAHPGELLGLAQRPQKVNHESRFAGVATAEKETQIWRTNQML